MTIPTDIRRQAIVSGVPLAALTDVYREFRQLARQEQEWMWELRKRVWSEYAYTPESRDFWRHGMQVRFRYAFAEGDMTNIPRWDDVAQSMACEFPELSGNDDVSQRLFELIREPHNRLPTAEETWREAFDYCLAHVDQWADMETESLETVPF